MMWNFLLVCLLNPYLFSGKIKKHISKCQTCIGQHSSNKIWSYSVWEACFYRWAFGFGCISIIVYITFIYSNLWYEIKFLNIILGPKNDRQRALVESFRHAWRGYKEHAWGHDNLKPVSGMASDWFSLGLTIVDSLDTAYIMGLTDGTVLKK